eukprot:CAMPEP_0203826722 /NCGR_PEP_ID=MMETSP0115-20131106/57276_1 /ASSEMBLY_ACC=CAM_ASM_000227 /TAXON_ID=33651 /ORGANISM="Bicosoecid sp, Strain ms1" /LENGTH=52 /DNA_ID=CAMNT_0050735771 /DNA_START=11 /DNA_END=169 /DNA_ORIENTATION=-
MSASLNPPSKKARGSVVDGGGAVYTTRPPLSGSVLASSGTSQMFTLTAARSA